MEQKLYFLGNCPDYSGEIEIPRDLQDLLDAGWSIAKISAYGYHERAMREACVLLLQREKNEVTNM